MSASDAAVLLEPIGVAHNAMTQLEVRGEDVLVLGCGAIGLLAANIAKVLGAKRSLNTIQFSDIFSVVNH